MAKFLGGYDSATAQQTTASYGPIAQARMFAAEAAAGVQMAMPTCTIRNLHIYVVSYVSSTTTTVRVQNNGVNTALAIAVTGSGTGHFENVTDTASFTAGDIGRINLQSGLQSVLGPVSFEQETAGDGLVAVYSLNASVASTTTGRIYYRGVGQTSTVSASPSAALDVVSGMTASMDRLRFRVVTNSKAAARTLTARVNNADSALSVTVPASTTGVFESVSAPISIVPGDTISFVYDALGTTGTIQGRSIDYRMTTANDLFDVLVGGEVVLAASADRFAAVIQGLNVAATVDTAVKTVIPFDTVASHLRAYLSGNSSSNAWAITLQKNSADSALSLAIAPFASGYFEDLTNTVSLTAGDTVAYRLTTRNSSVNFSWMGFSLSSGAGAVSVTPETGTLQIEGIAPSVVAGAEVTPLTGELTLLGVSPSLTEFSGVTPAPGTLILEGLAPVLTSDAEITVPSGELRLTGPVPGVFIGVIVEPPAGELLIEGGYPILAETLGAFASQSALLVRGRGNVLETRASQAVMIAVAEPPPPPTLASQSAVIAIGEVVPDVQASQSAVIVLAYADPCVTRRADFWMITRTDGKVFAFTSHDESVLFRGVVHKACKSLDPTASEAASEIGGLGNMELTGLISDEGITESDLYGGLFDDAFVEVWRGSWDLSVVDIPVRLAAGWCGSLSHGEAGFNMEVLGPGTKLSQHALVQTVTPGCRWVFGDPRTCGVDADSLGVGGGLASVSNRARFRIDASDPGTAPQWANGLIRWLTGDNAGISCEVKSVDWTTGEVVLWSPPPYLPEIGDTFFLRPGCDKTKETCKLYSNYLNFGGFTDLPGTDAIAEAPDAKY